jgi:hypothetical protein
MFTGSGSLGGAAQPAMVRQPPLRDVRNHLSPHPRYTE